MAKTTLLTTITLAPGTIKAFAGGTIPEGYLLCDGSAVSRSTYSDLFLAISTNYGLGDGVNTFNLPDLRGQFLRGAVPSALNSILGSGTASSNNATFTGHGLKRTGIKVRLNSGTLSGLSTGTTYYAIIVDDNTVAFATTQANAIAGTKIAISGANSGIIKQWEDPDAGSRAANTIGGASSGAGSIQGDAIRNITGSHGMETTTATGAFNLSGSLVSGQMSSGGAGSDYAMNFDASAVVPTGNDNRPQNIAINYIIKI